MITAEVNKLHAALAYADRGWSVLPLYAARRGGCACAKTRCASPGKHPIGYLAPRGVKDATTARATIEEWWTRSPEASIGISTGAVSGLVVVDLDSQEAAAEVAVRSGGQLPEGPRVRTGRG